MTEIKIADITLREKSVSEFNSLSFKEKTEIAKQLDNLNVDIIETAPVLNGKKDILFLHTISSVVKNSIISCPTGLSAESVSEAYEAIKNAAKPRLNVIVPVSTVQMEYMCGKKPDKVLDMISALTKHARSLCNDVEVSLADSTRAEAEFLYKAINAAVESGAGVVTLCDSAGIMLPAEFEQYIADIYANVPSLKNVTLSVECSNEMNMATACAVASINAGATQIKVATGSRSCPSMKSMANVFRIKSDVLGISTLMNMTVLDRVASRMAAIVSGNIHKSTEDASDKGYFEDTKFSASDDIKTIEKALIAMGYELPADEIQNVYDEFAKIAAKKSVGIKELDSIVASTAMQVAPTYKIKSYVINSGNILTPTASIELMKNGEVLHGISIGDGPIDAAFVAIEQITGKSYELDDFQIQSVTQGREAMAESIVKLRNEGKLYSGKGTSTDVVGASINAYISALNKICFEEEI